jgi:iron complex transport system ATP-binding protein
MEVLDMTRQYIKDNQALALIAIHDLNLALRHCDRLIVLAGGEVAAACASENLNSKDISRVYGVDARIEQCSNGEPIILLNSAAASGPNADPDLINTLEK